MPIWAWNVSYQKDNPGERTSLTRVFEEEDTARKVSKYGVFSGPYFPVFSPNTGKYGPDTPYVDTFYAVRPVPMSVVQLKKSISCRKNHYLASSKRQEKEAGTNFVLLPRP